MFIGALLLLELLSGVSVSVVDEDGNPLPGATVSFKAQDQTVFETNTSIRGEAFWLLVPEGSYTVTAGLDGFGAASTSVLVQPSKVAVVSLSLPITNLWGGCCLGCEETRIDFSSSATSTRFSASEFSLLPAP